MSLNSFALWKRKGLTKKVIRVHSDQDAAFVKGDLAARLLNTKVEQTDTGGYFSSKNAITERRIGLTASTCRGLLHRATGGTKYYRKLWAAALRFATVCINASARSDGRPAPFSFFTGVDYDFDKHHHVFGAKVEYTLVAEKRQSKHDLTGCEGIWVTFLFVCLNLIYYVPFIINNFMSIPFRISVIVLMTTLP